VKTTGRSPIYFLALALLSDVTAQQSVSPAPAAYRAVNSISGDSLRGDLSFLASNLLEGRGTPSRGLDIAAEYIAAQFRRANLEPLGDDGYFQTAGMLRAEPVTTSLELRVLDGSAVTLVKDYSPIVVSQQPVDLANVPIYKISSAHAEAELKAASVRGKVVEFDDLEEQTDALAKAALTFQPAAFLQVESGHPMAGVLIDPGKERAVYGGIPRLIVRGTDAVRLLRNAKAGETGIMLSIHEAAHSPVSVTLRNIAGLLRGSDPALRDQYILLTAHYDHLGRPNGVVFPGANDDGSGAVSVVEIAQALASLPVHPKRSIVFMTFFGEEEGSLGSRYYTGHPLVPLSKTVADLNLEQLGRTDSNAGPEISNATLTGFGYSSVARTLQRAGQLTAVKVYETPGGDEYFDRSDNLPFAEHGIPAHTLAVAFVFPDYHRPGDVWQKIDYTNMAKVDRMIAMGIILLANNPGAPQWNRENPNAAKYLKAR
jgi:hypothetical protein